MSAHPLMLTYLDVRGRCEPVYLMLVDAGVNFTSEIITQKQWDSLKASSSTGPPQFPYFALPVLKAEGMVLAETSAILAFLDEHLAEKYEAVSENDSLNGLSALLIYLSLRSQCGYTCRWFERHHYSFLIGYKT